MARSFTCPHCGSAIIVKYLATGEPAYCRSCGNTTPVPESTRETDADPSYTQPGSTARPSAPPSTEVAAYHPMTVGGVWGKAFSVYGRNFIKLIVIAAIFQAPLTIIQAIPIFSQPGQPGADSVGAEAPGFGFFDFGWLAIFALSVIVRLLAPAAIVYAVFQSLRGRDPSIANSLVVAVSRLLPVLGVTILTTVAIGLGFLLFIIPGLVIIAVLYVAVPPVVVEKAGVGEAIGRSTQLTKGRRLPIFGIFVVWYILYVVSKQVVLIIFGAIIGLGDQTLLVFFVVQQVLEVALTALSSVLVSTVYHDLRVEKEGMDTEALAAVFD